MEVNIMYVRTKKGEIFDCYESEQMHKPIYYPKKSKTNGYIDYEDVYKKSDNIIDILEVGDYVNGYKVNAEYAPYGVYIEIPFVDSESIGCNVDLIRTEEIESIVTREMFESIEYKVGD
jgi:hypothetical protein